MDWFQKAEKALNYLQESETEWSRYKALLKFQSERLKACVARLSNDAPESSEAAKKRWAEASEEYEELINECTEIAEEFYILDAKRMRAEQTIEIWRSVNSSMKRGGIA